MDETFVRIKRSILHSSLWLTRDVKTIREAFIDLLITMNREPKPVFINNKRFECNRFQSLKSISTWADRWNVEKYKAYRYLRRLEKLGYISIQNVKYTVRITIIKPERFFYLGSNDYKERCNGFATGENGKMQRITNSKQESSNEVCNGKKNEKCTKQVEDSMYKGKILKGNSSSLNSSFNELKKEKIISEFFENEKVDFEKDRKRKSQELSKGTGISSEAMDPEIEKKSENEKWF
ncbi:MAG: hypothetical protein GH151_11135 [Bacteroidetes bacterium]|nr:hypothetical protein [Bacteroidota bacterium]